MNCLRLAIVLGLVVLAGTLACSKKEDQAAEKMEEKPDGYKLKAKLTEVQINLDKCYLGIINYFDKPHAKQNGTVFTSVLPPAMPEPVCPAGRSMDTLSSEPARFNPAQFEEGGKAATLGKISLIIIEPTAACYQLTMTTPGETPKSGTAFTCHAWTDLDDDDKAAHWTKDGVYTEETSSFKATLVKRDQKGDDW
jgi:hypothetical protein